MKRGKAVKANKVGRAKKTRKPINLKKIIISLMIIGIISIFFLVVIPALKSKECVSIKSNLLADHDGNILVMGNDKWGYNYQAHSFNGFLDNTAKPVIPVTDGNKLMMKWNDALLSNQDCDGDNKLDNHYRYPSYRGSGAWINYRISGTYEMSGEICSWDESYKIEAIPQYAVINNGYWYSEGKQIGPAIGGEFAVTTYTLNDPCLGYDGRMTPGISPVLDVLKF